MYDCICTIVRTNQMGWLICCTYQYYRRQWLPNNEWS